MACVTKLHTFARKKAPCFRRQAKNLLRNPKKCNILKCTYQLHFAYVLLGVEPHYVLLGVEPHYVLLDAAPPLLQSASSLLQLILSKHIYITPLFAYHTTDHTIIFTRHSRILRARCMFNTKRDDFDTFSIKRIK